MSMGRWRTNASASDSLSVATASSRFCGLASLHASTSCSTNLHTQNEPQTPHQHNDGRISVGRNSYFGAYLAAGGPIAVMIADRVCMASRARFLFLSRMLNTHPTG